MKNTKQHAGIMASIEMTRRKNKNKEISMLSKWFHYDSIIIYIKKKQSKQLRCFHSNFQNGFHVELLSLVLTN